MLVSVLSVSGAPGVTSLCVALGMTWPSVRADDPPGGPSAGESSDRPALVVAECDPDGGVLSARFGLADRRGWGGLCADVRRRGGAVMVDPYVDVLPGGLHVLVGCRSGERGALRGPVRAHAFDILVTEARSREVIVDLGRFDPELEAGDRALARSDRVVVLVRPDVGSLVRLHDHVDRLRSFAGDAVGVVVRGRGPYANGAIARATGLDVLGVVPDAPVAAGALSGELPAARRLRRSRYLRAVASLAETLSSEQPRLGWEHDAGLRMHGSGISERLDGRRDARPAPTRSGGTS